LAAGAGKQGQGRIGRASLCGKAVRDPEPHPWLFTRRQEGFLRSPMRLINIKLKRLFKALVYQLRCEVAAYIGLPDFRAAFHSAKEKSPWSTN
jgi:hypothetical protein